MSRIAVSTSVDASPDDVWQIVEPIERHVEWMHDAVTIRFEHDQTRGVGTRFRCDTKVGPLRLTDHMTITEWEPSRVMGVDHTGVVTGRGRFTLEPNGRGGTEFSWEEDLRFPWWLGGRVGEVIGGRIVLAAIWRRNLRELKHVVESSTRSPAAAVTRP